MSRAAGTGYVPLSEPLSANTGWYRGSSVPSLYRGGAFCYSHGFADQRGEVALFPNLFR